MSCMITALGGLRRSDLDCLPDAQMRYTHASIQPFTIMCAIDTTSYTVQTYSDDVLRPSAKSHLYLSPCSLRPCGSRLFLIPNKVLETASLAPIIGLSTAIGTARTTAFSGP
jgi:hypothetical protein